MQIQNTRPTQKKNPTTPFSDFEITISSTLAGEKKDISKGRFLFWGDVKANDCTG